MSYLGTGQTYRLIRGALRLRRFTVAELHTVTGVPDNTIYGFLSDLGADGEQYLEWTKLPADGRGRPRKRYLLTQAGAAHLLDLDAEMAAAVENFRSPVSAAYATASARRTAPAQSLQEAHELNSDLAASADDVATAQS